MLIFIRFSPDGCFNLYFHSVGRVPSSECFHCRFLGLEIEMHDNAQHTHVRWEAFEGEWERLVQGLGAFELWDLRSRMLDSIDKWNAIMEFVKAILSVKELVEKEQQNHGVGCVYPLGRRRDVGRRRRQWAYVSRKSDCLVCLSVVSNCKGMMDGTIPCHLP